MLKLCFALYVCVDDRCDFNPHPPYKRERLILSLPVLFISSSIQRQKQPRRFLKQIHKLFYYKFM